MIVAEQKPIEEIYQMVKGYNRVLVLGCGTCVTVSFSGGQREVELLASILRIKSRVEGETHDLTEATVQRQCEWEFLDGAAELIKGTDAVLSLGCGVGVQAVAERFPNVVVLPGLNTCFLGLTVAPGEWEARCAACGECVLDQTGGVCPVVRCAKGLLNGPCGGSVNGRCEVGEGTTPCGWQLIYDRLAALGQLDKLERITPPKDWRPQFGQANRRIVREDLKV